MHPEHDVIVAPMTGTIVPIDQVADPVFSSKKMGDGFGVEPTSGTIVSPVGGTVTMVARTAHAFAVRTASGADVLVHMGIDTVELDGKPFTLSVAKGATVAAGDQVGTMDLAAVEAAGKSTTTMVVYTNAKKHGGSFSITPGAAKHGTPSRVSAPPKR